MADNGEDKRKLHALRKHIDSLLADGAAISSREPLTLTHAGQTLRVKYGMLVGHYQLPDMVEPIIDHEWPDTLRQIAAGICMRQLDKALQALDLPKESALANSQTASIQPK